MREATQGIMWESSGPVWETLELLVRGKDQEFTQVVLEDEVTEYLGGRKKSQRKAPVEAARPPGERTRRAEAAVHGRPEGHVPLLPVLELDQEHESTNLVRRVCPRQRVGVTLHEALADELGKLDRIEGQAHGQVGSSLRRSRNVNYT